ncbi:glycine cleavage system aminomethyltransferase GcvT [Caldiplasma sukawensis]
MKTVLYDNHVMNGAKMVDFHSWNMPLYYESILKEHMSVRKKVGIFDVSHMGDLFIEGDNSTDFLLSILPSDIENAKENSCTYTAFLNSDGKMIDDTIIYKFSDEKYLSIPNAATTDLIYNHVKSFDKKGVEIKNVSDEYGCIAVQGPESQPLIEDLGFEFPESFRFYEINHLIVSGTGYTGEKGVEIIGKNKNIVEMWEKLSEKLKNYDGSLCGLGARDTLRMEKGFLLSGQDFNNDRTPREAGISFILTNRKNYMGKEFAERTDFTEIFRGFIAEEKGAIPRTGSEIFDQEGNKIGIITSGSLSPVLGMGIGLGYIQREFSGQNKYVYIDVRGKRNRFMVSRPKMVV